MIVIYRKIFVDAIALGNFLQEGSVICYAIVHYQFGLFFGTAMMFYNLFFGVAAFIKRILRERKSESKYELNQKHSDFQTIRDYMFTFPIQFFLLNIVN